MTTDIGADITAPSTLFAMASIEPWSNGLGLAGWPAMLEREQGELEAPGQPELAEDGR